jgi:hypothetical protein
MTDDVKKKTFPSRRAAVYIPTAAFVPIDVLLLSSSGKSWLSVGIYALFTAPLIGWWLNRNYNRRLAAYERKQSELLNDGTSGPMIPLIPPTGSWANPNKRQKLLGRWGKNKPFRHR